MEHSAGLTTGLVPTMGAFHEGHLQLMRAARIENDRVVVSLFVNPTQFGVGEDFERYPRNLDRDIALAESVGVDVLFAPDTQQIYPRPGCTIHVPVVTERWEGQIRPHHFSGVATVVCKLFHIVCCDVAYFGQKDLQQCIVIRRMIDDLNIPVRFSMQPTVREPDGLAMSSRNAYLTPEDRARAPMLQQLLQSVRKAIKEGNCTPDQLDKWLHSASTKLEIAGFSVDYFECIDLEDAHAVRDISRPCALIVAARIGRTRLIDNLLI